MKTILLIEETKQHQWQVVKRECTRTGLSPHYYSIVAQPNDSFRDARKDFERIKFGFVTLKTRGPI